MNKWLQARTLLKMRAVLAPPTSPRAARLLLWLCFPLLFAVSGCAYSRALKEGDAFVQQQKWAEADAAYSRAQALDPTESEAVLKQRSVRHSWSQALYLEATQKGDDWVAASQLLKRALQLDSENSAAQALQATTLNSLVRRGEAALKAERLPDALLDFDAVLDANPLHPEGRRGKFGVQAAWADRWFRRGEELEAEGKEANALLAYLRADQERVGATPARESAERVRQQLRQEVTFFVQVSPLVDRGPAPDVAARLAPGRLSAALPTQLPIKVITEPPSSKIGLRLQLALEKVAVLKDKEMSQRSQRYLAGNRAVPNPKRASGEVKLRDVERNLEHAERVQDNALRDYLHQQAELRLARDAAERCREKQMRACRESMSECSRTQAADQKAGKSTTPCDSSVCEEKGCAGEEKRLSERIDKTRSVQTALENSQGGTELLRREVQRSREALFREPVTVDEPMYSDFVFDVERHRLTVKASVTTLLEDLAQTAGTPALTTQDFSAAHEDSTHRGYERYGVLSDPLQLKDEADLRSMAGDKALGEIARRVKARFDSYRQRRVADARHGMVRASADDVVETAVRALLLAADAPPEDILVPLMKARGIENPEALFKL